MPAFQTPISQTPPKCHDPLPIANPSSKSRAAFITAAASSITVHINIETLTFRRSTIEFHRQMVAETIALEVVQVGGKVDLNIATVTTRILVNMRRLHITGTRRPQRLLQLHPMNPTPPATLISNLRKISST